MQYLPIYSFKPTVPVPMDIPFSDAWVPAVSSEREYLEIGLGAPTSLYGLELQGSRD